MEPVLYPAKNKEIYDSVTIVSYLILRKTSARSRQVGHSYMGHIWIALWVSGSSESTDVTHFQH